MLLRKFSLFICGVAVFPLASALADDLSVAAYSMNALGLDLLARVAKPDENALLSPYSIQSALAMTYAGAAGETKAEMAKVLHYPADEAALHRSFAAFAIELEEIHTRTLEIAKESSAHGGPSEPITLEVANRLYGQGGYEFRPEFLAQVKDNYGVPLQQVDFKKNSESARDEINRWVALRTHEKIKDLVPSGAVDMDTRLALVNAVFLKAPWETEFSVRQTKNEPFWVNGRESFDVRTMQSKRTYGYARGDDFCAVTIRYSGASLQLLILLPDAKDGVAALEKKLTPQILADCSNPYPDEFTLFLPKFKLAPPLIALKSVLQSLGMQTAFDEPLGSANFDRMALRTPKDYLCMSEVFHKTFLEVDEKGTEASAATIVDMPRVGYMVINPHPPKPIEIRVDHPFLFAIQHRMSGACLFLGRVVDPR